MPFAAVAQNKRIVVKFIQELVKKSTADDRKKEQLAVVLKQKVWVSPMLSRKELRPCFRAACKKLIKHTSIKRLDLHNELRLALKTF